MTTISRSGLFAGRKAYWKEPRVGSSLCVTDFLSTRSRRVAEWEEDAGRRDLALEIQRAAIQRRYAVRLLDPVEHLVYSLVSAAALAALLMGFFGMADFARHAESTPSAPTSRAFGASGQNFSSQFEQADTRPN